MKVNFVTTQAAPLAATLNFKEIKTASAGLDEVATTGAYTCVIGDESEFGRAVLCEWFVDRVKLIDAWFDTVEEAERQALDLLRLALRLMIEAIGANEDVVRNSEELPITA